MDFMGNCYHQMKQMELLTPLEVDVGGNGILGVCFLYAQNRNSMWLCVGVHNVKNGENGCQFCVF